MHPVVAIALKDLRQRLRDRSAWVLGFIAPMAVAGLISVAFGGAQSFHTSVAVVDDDHGAIATGFTQFLRSPDLHDLLTVRTADGRDALVPFVKALVPEVDVAGGRVVIADRPGLVTPLPEDAEGTA